MLHVPRKVGRVMLMQFIELGVYRRNDETQPDHPIVFDVIVEGEVVKTCKRRTTAIIELAAAIDDQIGVENDTI